MMKAYPEYKETKLMWFGDVPKHWIVKKVAWDMPFLVGWTPSTSEAEYFEGENIWVSIEDMKGKWLSKSKKQISDKAIKDKGISCVPEGSLLFSFKLSVGKVAFANADLYTNEAIASFVENESVSLRFLYYAAPLFLPRFGQENIYGALLMNQERIKSAKTFMPDFNEQVEIANFLDSETSKIDSLISEKESFITLLEEKRQALINHVAKGLNKNLEIKEVPFTKYLSEQSDYRGKTPDKTDSGILLVTARNIKMGFIDYECSKEYIAEADYEEVMRRGFPKVGDILFTTEAPLGNVALVDNENIALAQRVIRFRTNESYLNSKYTALLMQSDYFQNQIKQLAQGITAQGIKASKLNQLKVYMPPLEEQYEIIRYVEEKNSRIDALVKETNESIELLKEHRTALISAAVTGKIDVREEV